MTAFQSSENQLSPVATIARSLSTAFFSHLTNLAGNSTGLRVLWAAVDFGPIGWRASQLGLPGGALLFYIVSWRAITDGLLTIVGPVCVSNQEKLLVYWIASALVAYTALINSHADVGDPRQRSPVACLIILQSFIALDILHSPGEAKECSGRPLLHAHATAGLTLSRT